MGGNQWRWPRVHEVDVTFGLVECHGCAVALYLDVLDAQVGHTPHFVYHHFGISGVDDLFHRRSRHIQYFLGLVDGSDAVHVVEIGHVSCPNGLAAIHPQLSEFQRSAVEVGHLCHIIFALFLPSCEAYAAAHGHLPVGHDTGAVVFGSDDDGLVQPVGAFAQVDAHLLSSVESSGLTSLLQRLFYGVGTGFYDNVCRLHA